MSLLKRSTYLFLALSGKAIDLIVTFSIDPTLNSELNPISVHILDKNPISISILSFFVAVAIGLFCTFTSLKDVSYTFSQENASSPRKFSLMYQLYGFTGISPRLLYANVKNWRLFSYLLARFSLFLLISTSLTTSLLTILLIIANSYLSNKLFLSLFFGLVAISVAMFLVGIEKVVRRDYQSRETE